MRFTAKAFVRTSLLRPATSWVRFFHKAPIVSATPQPVEIVANDGFQLSGTMYRASRQNRKGATVVLNSATAVPQKYYLPFATYLADEHGYDVLTYDYRGVGESRPPDESVRDMRAKWSDWCMRDQAAAVEFAVDQQDMDKLYIIGHSVGGTLPGMLPEHLSSKVNAMVTISSQSGYWRLQGAEQKLMVWFHMSFTIPFFSRLFGYLPWSWFTPGAQDLPAGIAIEWARHTRKPLSLLHDKSLPRERYNAFNCPVLAYSIDDDKWGTSEAVDFFMHRAYPNVERRHLLPSDYGIGKIGHFGFFRAANKAAWQDPLEWLQRQ